MASLYELYYNYNEFIRERRENLHKYPVEFSRPMQLSSDMKKLNCSTLVRRSSLFTNRLLYSLVFLLIFNSFITVTCQNFISDEYFNGDLSKSHNGDDSYCSSPGCETFESTSIDGDFDDEFRLPMRRTLWAQDSETNEHEVLDNEDITGTGNSPVESQDVQDKTTDKINVNKKKSGQKLPHRHSAFCNSSSPPLQVKVSYSSSIVENGEKYCFHQYYICALFFSFKLPFYSCF